MGSGSRGIKFSVPYEIAAVRPLRQTTVSERLQVLRAAYFNTELIPQDVIYIDLSTDSGVSSLSTNQLALLGGARWVEPGMGLGTEGSPRASAQTPRQSRRPRRRPGWRGADGSGVYWVSHYVFAFAGNAGAFPS